MDRWEKTHIMKLLLLLSLSSDYSLSLIQLLESQPESLQLLQSAHAVVVAHDAGP